MESVLIDKCIVFMSSVCIGSCNKDKYPFLHQTFIPDTVARKQITINIVGLIDF